MHRPACRLPFGLSAYKEGEATACSRAVQPIFAIQSRCQYGNHDGFNLPPEPRDPDWPATPKTLVEEEKNGLDNGN